MELFQLIRGHRHCPVTSQLCKCFCFMDDNSIPFHHSSVLLQDDGESLSAYSKNSYLTIFPNSHTSSGSNHSCSTEGVPAPPAYTLPPHHEDIKGRGKENQKPECLGECLEQKEWKLGEHSWWWIFRIIIYKGFKSIDWLIQDRTLSVSSFSLFAMSPSYMKSTWELLLQQTEPEGTISSLSAQSSHSSSVSLFVLLASNTAWSIPHGLAVTGSFPGCISIARALAAKGTQVGGG